MALLGDPPEHTNQFILSNIAGQSSLQMHELLLPLPDILSKESLPVYHMSQQPKG